MHQMALRFLRRQPDSPRAAAARLLSPSSRPFAILFLNSRESRRDRLGPAVAPLFGVDADRHAAGFTLIEALIAIALVVVCAAGVGQLFAVAAKAVRASREQAASVLLAAAKMEQLRSLEWTYASVAGIAVERSDFSTNVSSDDLSGPGLGLTASPAGSLSASTAYYADYLDAQGRSLGSGASPPRNAVFVRRWAVQPLPSDPSRTLVLQVLVTTVHQDRLRAGPWRFRSGTETVLVSVLTRKE